MAGGGSELSAPQPPEELPRAGGLARAPLTALPGQQAACLLSPAFAGPPNHPSEFGSAAGGQLAKQELLCRASGPPRARRGAQGPLQQAPAGGCVWPGCPGAEPGGPSRDRERAQFSI